ncbi:MAG: diphthine synthase, partial [Thermoproteota archaeon]
MLWFVGLGISGLGSISLDAQNILKKADIVYLEQFTSIIPKSDITKLKKLVKGEFKTVKRWMVEDGQEILKNAKKKNVVLLSYGDPYIATTHIELRTRAIQEKIKTNTIHASSALTALVGECGLHYYKIGKVVTIMKEIQSTSAYYAIYGNLLSGDHTILLLEYNQDADFFLDPKDALSNLLASEKEQTRNVLSQNIFVIVASRIGLKDQRITAGKISSLIKL